MLRHAHAAVEKAPPHWRDEVEGFNSGPAVHHEQPNTDRLAFEAGKISAQVHLRSHPEKRWRRVACVQQRFRPRHRLLLILISEPDGYIAVRGDQASGRDRAEVEAERLAMENPEHPKEGKTEDELEIGRASCRERV